MNYTITTMTTGKRTMVIAAFLLGRMPSGISSPRTWKREPRTRVAVAADVAAAVAEVGVEGDRRDAAERVLLDA
jgi:hypothetical protein